MSHSLTFFNHLCLEIRDQLNTHRLARAVLAPSRLFVLDKAASRYDHFASSYLPTNPILNGTDSTPVVSTTIRSNYARRN